MSQPVHYSDILTTMQNGKKVSFRVVVAELFIWTVSVEKKEAESLAQMLWYWVH